MATKLTPNIEVAVVASPVELGAAIRNFRKSQSLRQADIGEKTSQTQAALAALENGDPKVGVKTVFEVAAALGLRVEIKATAD